MTIQSGENTRKGRLHAECPRCGGRSLKRAPRKGFLQRKVFSAFGYYPWKCIRCSGSFLLKKRGVSTRHREPRLADRVTS